jgi:hypothetical protein
VDIGGLAEFGDLLHPGEESGVVCGGIGHGYDRVCPGEGGLGWG